MFNIAHILYMVISALLSAGMLVLFRLKVTNEKMKIILLRSFAIVTVIIHFSSLWVDFFATGTATVQSSMLLPIYPCNVIMWLLLVVSFLKNKSSVLYKLMSEFTFWAGAVCGSIGIIFNENFGSNPTLADYEILKGLLSHSTMLIGCIYLLVGGFVKIRVTNVISVCAGLCFFVVDGVVINTLYSIFDLSPCNSMYLLEPPFEAMPWFNTFVIGVIAVTVCFSVSAFHEMVALPKKERWYYRWTHKKEEMVNQNNTR